VDERETEEEVVEVQPGVIVRGVDIPFGDLVGLLVKVSFAAIPAGIIVYVAGWFVIGILSGILSGT